MLEAVTVVLRGHGGFSLGGAEELSAQGQPLAPAAGSQETEVAYAAELRRQDMKQKATDELGSVQGHRLALAVVAVVAPVEADLAVVDGQEAVIRDGDAMGVAAQIVEDLGGAGEGRLGVDHPLGLAQGSQVAVEGGRIGERGEGAGQAQAALAEGAIEVVEEESAGAAREDTDGREEAGAAGDPAVACRSDAATGDDAVQVGVELELLPPRVQDGEETGLGAEVLGVGGDLAQGAGGGPEEDVEEGALVLQGDGGELLGEREDQVEVLAREQLVTALLEPRFAGGPLALGAVAVAARAVAEAAVAAAVALLDLAAEGGGAAELDGGQDTPLHGGQGHGEAGLEGLAVAAEDVRDFERRTAHRAGRESPPTGSGRGSRSSGLGAEHTLEQAICR